MTARRSICEALADRLTAIGPKILSDTVLLDVRKRVLDVAGVAMIGAETAGVASLETLDESTDVLALSAGARASEADDIHVESCVTIGAIVIPAALWTARRLGATDEQLACGIVAGYEAGISLGLAIRGADRVYQGTWPSFYVAPFAAAAAASHFFGNAEVTANALAIAAAHISGDMPAPVEPSARWLSFAFATQVGIRCAMLARSGLRGDLSYLERRLTESFGGEVEWRPLRDQLGKFALLETDMKPFCTARQLLAAAEAVSEATKVDTGSIAAIRLRVPAQCLRMVDCPDPSPAVALASAQLQVSIAALRPALLYQRDRAAGLQDPEVRALMSRVFVSADPDLSNGYPKQWGAKVEVEYTHRLVERSVSDPFGSHRKPLDSAAVEAKLSRFSLPAGYGREIALVCDDIGSGHASAGRLLETFRTHASSRVAACSEAEGVTTAVAGV